jgi:CelD/BcsL family acetyltransferase involved in cellulose biosynthesis
MLRVEWISTPEGLAALRGQWNELAQGVPFRYWEWLHTWWDHYGPTDGSQRCELCMLAVFDGPVLVGVAPFYLAPLAAGGAALRLLGSGEVCSDYLSLLSRPEDTQRVSVAVADWLDRTDRGAARGPSWLRLELENVLDEEPSWQQLAARLEAAGFEVSRRPGIDCWRLDLPDRWEDYQNQLSKNHRKQIRVADQEVFSRGRARLHTAATVAELERGWPILVDLHQRRWQALGQAGCFASPRYAAFHRAAAPRLLACGALRLQWLELDGRPIAAEYQLQSGQVLYGYQSGLDPTLLDQQPGNLSKVATFRAAIDEGFKTIDYLRGSEEYKRRSRFQPHAAVDVHVLSRRGLARLHNGVWQASGRAKAWIKRGLKLAGLRPQ